MITAMITKLNILRLLLVLLALTAGVQAQDAMPPVAKTFATFMQRIASPESTTQIAAREEWQQYCFQLGQPGLERECAEACRTMLKAVQGAAGEHSGIGKLNSLFILRQIERLGDEESLAVLIQLLDNPDTDIAEAARKALVNNPSPKADSLLLARLKNAAHPANQLALIRTLGKRRNEKTVSALGEFLIHSDPEVMFTAAVALEQIGTSNADAALLAALNEKSVNALAHPILKRANRLAAQKNFEQAKTLVSKLRSIPQLQSQYQNAVVSCVLATTTQKPAALLEFLSNPLSVDSALAHIRDLSETEAAELVSRRTELPMPVQSRLLLSLAIEKRQSIGNWARQAAFHSTDKVTMISGINALGYIGTAKTVVNLLPLTVSNESQVANAAKKAITRLSDEKVNVRLISELQKSETSALTAKVIKDILNARRCLDLPDLVSADLTSDDQEVRNRARNVFNRLGTPQHIAMLLKSLNGIPRSEFSHLSKAVLSICRRIPDANRQAAPLIEAYPNAADKLKIEMLSLIGQIGGKQAGEFIEAKRASKVAFEADAAITALANWPNAEFAETLLKIASDTRDANQRIRAIRGLARVVVLPSSKFDDAAQLQHLSDAFELADRIDEKRLILDRAKAIDTIESFRFISPHLSTPQLADVAEKSLVQIARIPDLRGEYSEVPRSLQSIIAQTKNEKLRVRAQSYLAESP